ncbi:hypothetical protein HPB50_014670 [Hyalomma asiaticum]|uniref:Uncharacterized protein n=1 Tax=Hyalomma asiaticum TaxID=266040 RepID=A0ACB7SA31_HYAAI|nr:hypothetical protein HPB50_014670 [Hyalomma asiaticum]
MAAAEPVAVSRKPSMAPSAADAALAAANAAAVGVPVGAAPVVPTYVAPAKQYDDDDDDDADDPGKPQQKSMMYQASKSTVKRRLYQAGLKSRTAEQKVLLRTASKDKQLQFAQRHAGWIEQDWKKVIFTDESSFTTSWDQKTRIRRPDCTL